MARKRHQAALPGARPEVTVIWRSKEIAGMTETNEDAIAPRVRPFRKRRQPPKRHTHGTPPPHPCRDEWAKQECDRPDGRTLVTRFHHGAHDRPVGDAIAADN